jgi:hypothetical protein
MDVASSASVASPEPSMCPFLRAVNEDGSVKDPINWPDEANRCTALGDAAPQSLRQQEYACLSSAHVNCPRFLRGALVMIEPPSSIGGGRQLTPAIVGALLVLAASFALSVGFVVANGGMDLPVAVSARPSAAAGSPGPDPSSGGVAGAGASPSPSAAPSIEAAPSAEPSPAATPSPSPTVTAAPSVAPSVAATPGSSSDRYDLLKPCPDAPDCWIYLVRNGDNLVSIARYFGIPLDTVTELNPWTTTTPLVAGQELRLPPPTR